MLAAVGDKLRAMPWAQDLLPDMLWLSSQLADGSDESLLRCGRLLDAVDEAVGPDRDGFPEHWFLTGRLVDFEAMPENRRRTVIECLIDRELYDLVVPDDFAHSLGMYPAAPGSWLLEPWRARGGSVDPEAAYRHLRSVIGASMDGREPVPTRAKMIVFRQMIKHQRVSFAAGVAGDALEALTRYPKQVTDEERKRAESFVRASFLSFAGVRAEEDTRATQWAARFWRSNWRLYPCEWPEKPVLADVVSDEERDEFDAAADQIRSAVEELQQRFFALAAQTDPDLYNPDRYEVLTGLIGRLLRYLAVFVRYPPLWTMEHGAPLLRAVVESRIVFRWLLLKDSDDIYQRFKAFGRGRLKLLKLHFEEYIEGMDDPPKQLLEYAEYLNMLVNQDMMEEFQEIDLSGTFSGIDMRKMAYEVQLERDYRLLFAPASSNVHGEWTVIDEYVLDRCRNPLHRNHRIVREAAPVTLGPLLVESLIDSVAELVDEYDAATSGRRGFGGLE